MHKTAAICLSLFLAPLPAFSECIGRNLIDDMAPETRAMVDAATEGIPFHSGILWQASKGSAQMTIVGTYHFADPRHGMTLARIAEPLASAAALYVEAGPDEEARLSTALSSDPTLMIDPDGPTLPERLEQQEWTRLSDALSERGIPAILASKMRPWYVSLMLGISPCMMRVIAEAGDVGGLDGLLIERAQGAEIPIRALEPWDTVFGLFAALSPKQELDMIRASLPAAEHADDYAVTLASAYFAGDIWRIWEFGRFDAYQSSGLSKEAVDEQLALAQVSLMDRRNQAWIQPLVDGAEAAAKDGKGILAGFGALHLPGEQGVLQLLQDRGWRIERLDG